ncbi:MAG TPA: hypothetical protein VFQ35_10930 [Polyangiaceae bacterium]|nr:hypothetical protein [Polyangiaceae bacterium]
MARLNVTSLFARLLGVGVIVAGVAASSPAHATGKVGLDLEAALPSDVPDTEQGWGGAARLGNEWNLVLLKLTPEFEANYHKFGGTGDAKQFSALAGGRVGVGLIIQPSVYAHAGVGHFGYRRLYQGMYEDIAQTSFAYDVGAALDLTVLPLIDVGAHASVNGIAGNKDADPFTWYSIGAHVAISFPN